MRNEELIVAHMNYARKIATNFGNRAALRFDASDLESEAVYALVRAGQRFDPERGVPFHVFVRIRIAGRLDEWVTQRNQTPFAELLDVHHAPGDPHESVMRREIRAAVKGLPVRWRKVLSLRFWYGFTQKETARQMGVGQCRVGQIQRQAFERLRERAGMSRVIVNVAIGSRWNQNYPVGQARLRTALLQLDDWRVGWLRGDDALRFYTNGYPAGSPRHEDVPFAFKAYALKEAATYGDQLLWCDSCIVPIRSLKPVWDYAAEHGVWLGKNGWKNSDWTADSAYPDLFPNTLRQWTLEREERRTNPMDDIRAVNARIEHVVATAFAIDLRHVDGRDFLAEYFRLASETLAFCGLVKEPRTKGGPVPGITHRHDQTAASVIAWRLGIPLTSPPEFFAYRGSETEKTILVADGNY